ncbi:MAG: cell division protein ZapA [Deltaproteobacteria bacterium]|nr:cell division protein ZapA [Deltaproteobacteria bacterium]MBW2503175.1 cell division protein ZapA [Deltaproteobacteria bacterium]MBW2519896.1 cell division protein ZapA [Deltaproteobacteria bacterium]
MKQSIQVSILGQQFHLKSDAPAEHVRRVAGFVEKQIQNVVNSGHAVDTLQAAILALLNVSAAHLDRQEKSDGSSSEVSQEAIERMIKKIEAVFSN